MDAGFFQVPIERPCLYWSWFYLIPQLVRVGGGVGSFFFPRYELTTNFRIPIHGERQCNKSVIQAIDFSLPVRHLIFAKDVNRCRSSWREPAPRERNLPWLWRSSNGRKALLMRGIFWEGFTSNDFCSLQVDLKLLGERYIQLAMRLTWYALN